MFVRLKIMMMYVIEGLTLMLQSEQRFLRFYLTTQLFFRR